VRERFGGVTMLPAMDDERKERRFARWICRDCRSARFAPAPKDGLLKCPICYAAVRFDEKRHARRDPVDRGKRPEEITPEA
jgi:uncharacterized Zn finger protein (UPF0148 family)